MYAHHVKRVLIVLKDLPREINYHHPSEIQHVSSFHTHRYGRHSTPISAQLPARSFGESQLHLPVTHREHSHLYRLETRAV
jgi:hypothetical protein